jgi:sigma-B regulation protein RsbU (phosphoserine phosphatase)
MLELINRGFCQTSTVEGYYLTATVIVFDPERRSGYFASASHPPTLVFSRNGGTGYALRETLEAHSFMIGIVEGARYGDVPFSLDEGDFLLMATDGLYESEDARGHRLGTDGVTAYFEETGAETPLEKLYDVARSRNPYREMRDDISMLRLTVGPRGT